jgi:hypothetical protein
MFGGSETAVGAAEVGVFWRRDGEVSNPGVLLAPVAPEVTGELCGMPFMVAESSIGVTADAAGDSATLSFVGSVKTFSFA